ncbi:alkyl sulfatase dimerization domain-containing protein [Phenylobacterium sp.]|uniref:alkyl/aryl-sulfatase n=1 Tax=Phenylobacterium sp. TaxID=1871053 RepID=UPI0025D3781A|nr:alkyl sulfatase dimerization domain-containing protein [Phenylobacterium sp.]MCA6313520.1 MBL fold metallo-hydrolase [Phenylobacterium sp.]
MTSLDRKDASPATRAALAAARASLPPDDGGDFRLADRGFIASIPDADIPGAWSLKPYDFLGGEATPTVHPALWRQAQLNMRHGLFEVTPGVYQVRGFDISTVTFVEGERGYIVIDPLTSAAPARTALELMRTHRGDRPVTAVIYTHSHVDHYGGILGVVSPEEIAAGMPIIAPEGFLKEAVSENVLAGNAMSRRATYMYGALLPKDARGHVDSGLGKGVSGGKVALVPPTVSIARTGERLVVDGVEIVFQVTPDAEAPAEMNFFFPKFRALCMAENCTCHLHNIYTPRGAQVRDSKSWSRYIDEARDLFGADSDVMFASHHWPRWGGAEIDVFLRKQRDLYKFIHDQTLRLANHGLNAPEIAEVLRLPPTLASEWYTRGFYGTVSHNAKAVYQRYLGWFDGNPAHLNPHPPVEAGRRYVKAIGGPDAVLAEARRAQAEGDYRWGAEVLNHLVFADPGNAEARNLQADLLEQMGYQSESGPWRDFYLTGAQELRTPIPASDKPRQATGTQLRNLPAESLLDSLSVRLNGEAAGDMELDLTLCFPDGEGTFTLRVENAVLHHRDGEGAPEVSLSRDQLIDLVLGAGELGDVASGQPGEAALGRLLSVLDRFDLWFGIVTP